MGTLEPSASAGSDEVSVQPDMSAFLLAGRSDGQPDGPVARLVPPPDGSLDRWFEVERRTIATALEHGGVLLVLDRRRAALRARHGWWPWFLRPRRAARRLAVASGARLDAVVLLWPSAAQPSYLIPLVGSTAALRSAQRAGVLGSGGGASLRRWIVRLPVYVWAIRLMGPVGIVLRPRTSGEPGPPSAPG